MRLPKTALLLVTLLLGGLGAAPLLAQEPATEESDTTLEEEAPELPMPIQPSAQDEAAKQILELFKKVDKSLSEIDNMLFDMGAGEVPLEAPEDSGLGQLLDLTREASRGVVDDIDRILELAEAMSQQQSSSSSGSGGKPQSQQPSGQNDKQQEGQGKEQEAKSQSDPSGKPEEGQEPKDKGEPQGGEDSQDEGQNSKDEGSQQHPTGAGSQAEATERWGELPERVRETFRNQGGEEAPLYYRDWIDSYYRHLNQRDG